ncbi:hypothetical protein ADUPG1_007192 [Aduncisulcus paluster]|uniref:Uncharacterized protein n=1 Tax=Aduncisulcus paluster TaxID=2918883 RepID=A0ABQ5KL28_9EUKA|nr:hypothetical protein ADUPG1_007192 [Aduncisulcus paluster]
MPPCHPPDQCVEYARWLEAALEGDYRGCQCPPREQGCAVEPRLNRSIYYLRNMIA